LENIPGSNDHNSARISIGPDLKLYYSVGDMGAGQFDNISRANNAQNINIYEGKILRLNTEPDGIGSWIPADNPFTNAGQTTAVYTLGHRNPQGLVWGNVNGTDILYSSEHGPFSDDEINAIQVGRNYGWPQVAGYCDGNYNGMTIGGFAVANEQNNCATLNAKEPLRSIFPSSNPPTGGDNMTWPSIGPSGTDFYGSLAIPGWQNSLLVATLKGGVISRYKLSNDGQSIISDTINYFRGMGRYRDIVVSPDGLKLYVACDSSGSTSGPTGNVTTTPANPGSILEFTYQTPGPAKAMSQLLTESKVSDDLKDKSIDVYPNPARTYFIIYNYAVENRLVQLFDINGKLVRNIQTKELATRVDINNLSNGIYVLRVKEANGKNIRTEKIVIIR
jgi:PQQ-dependent dehydrogenase (s-GDH family)